MVIGDKKNIEIYKTLSKEDKKVIEEIINSCFKKEESCRLTVKSSNQNILKCFSICI